MSWHLGLVWREGCTTFGPLSAILALTPQVYHPLEVGPFYTDFGSENAGYSAWNGTVSQRSDPFCLAARLHSATLDYIYPTGVSFAGSTNTTTYSIFAKLADSFPLAGFQMLSAKGNTPATFAEREHTFGITTAGALQYRMFNGTVSTTFDSSSGVVPTDGEWHMYSVSFSASTAVRMYVDGVQVFSQTSSIPAAKNNPDMTHSWGAISQSVSAAPVANTFTPANTFNGWLAHGFIEQSIVSAATLLGIYQAIFP